MVSRRSSASPGNAESPRRFIDAARAQLAACLLAIGAVGIAEGQIPPVGGRAPGPEPVPPPIADEADLERLLNEQDLYLEVFRGEQSTGLVLPVRVRSGRLAVAPADLRAVGVLIPDEAGTDAGGLVTLDDLPGLTYQYQQATQRLFLRVPSSLRPIQRPGYEEPSPVAPLRPQGLLIGYDVNGWTSGDSRNAAAVASGYVRWFGRAGTVEVSGTGRAVPGASRLQRSEARWTYADPARMWRWTAGDLVGGALAWTRSARMAGVQWRRDFGVRPGLVTSPMPRFSTVLAEAATLELFINDARRIRTPLEDGLVEFALTPGVSGAVRASLIATDILGRVTETTYSFYSDQRRLARGLTDFSVEAGFIRRAQFSGRPSYGSKPVASVIWRRGLTHTFTLESHGQAGEGRWVLGIGTVWSPGGRWGLLSASAARSDGVSRGGRYTLGYQWSTLRYGIEVRSLRRDAGFRDLGDLSAWAGLPAPTPRAEDDASLRLRIPRGSLSLLWRRSLYDGGRRWERLGLSTSLSLPPRL